MASGAHLLCGRGDVDVEELNKCHGGLRRKILLMRFTITRKTSIVHQFWMPTFTKIGECVFGVVMGLQIDGTSDRPSV